MYFLSVSFLLSSYLYLGVVVFWLLLMFFESSGLLSGKRYRFIASRLELLVSFIFAFVLIFAFLFVSFLFYSCLFG